MKAIEENVERFVYFVNERQRIATCKNNGLKRPWTTDRILDRHHFCNVHREDDRGTKKLKTLMYHMGVPISDLPTFWTAARMFNHAPSTEVYWRRGAEAVKEMQDRGEKVFNTAYLVTTCGARMDKIDYVNRVVHAVAATPISPLSCAEAFRDLRTVDGLGSFMCGQIVADLKYTPYLSGAPDWRTFSVMGPGSKKMLDLLFGGGTTERNYEERISELDRLTKGRIPDMHRQDLQNCCCEGAKYIKYLHNLPGRRRYYR